MAPRQRRDAAQRGSAPAPRTQRPQRRSAAGGSAKERLVRALGGPGSPMVRAAVKTRHAGVEAARRVGDARGRLHRLPAPSTGHAPVRVAGYPVRARVIADATPLREHQRLVAAIGAALAARSVDYFVVPGPTGVSAVAVPGESRAELYAGLAELAAAQDLLVAPLGHGPTPRFRPYVRPFPATVTQMAVWQPVVAADRQSLLGPDSRVTIQLWRTDRDGTRWAPAENRYAPALADAAQIPRVDIAVGDTLQPTLGEMAEPHIEDIAFPVDLVYTWVDGLDPVWRERMISARERHHLPVNVSSVDDSRYVSVDELRYSLRSVFAFAPWFRRIFLVTDRQVPDWLSPSDDRVTVVSHEEIWADAGQLPVFNSHAIESRLHHVPGLTEHYVYLNDDVFFGQMITANTFFTPGGLARFFPSPTRIGLGDPVLGEPPGSTAAKNDRRVLREAVGAIQTQRLKHTAHAQRRSVAMELEERFPEVYSRTSGSQFRSPSDISPIALQTWYAYRTGRAVPGSVRYTYIGLSRRRHLDRLDELRGGRYAMFCLNAEENKGEGDHVEHEHMAIELKRFLEASFPFRSPVER